MRSLLRLIVCLLLTAAALLPAGCLSGRPQGVIEDLERLPQDPLFYLDPATADLPLLPPEEQQERSRNFLERFFAPWHAPTPLENTRNPFWAVGWLEGRTVYGENLLPVGRARLAELVARTDRKSYPSLDLRAVTVRNSDLRALPSAAPLFLDPGRAGEGFPFDYLQHTSLPAGTPLHITHRSLDGAWVFAETALAYGWLPEADLAWVDEDFVRAFESGRYITPVRDGVPIVDSGGRYRFAGGIGTLLPLAGSGSEVLLAVADRERRAVLERGILPPCDAESFPLPLTPARIASLANRLLGQPYGWGGLFGGRDCSATLRDLFAPFGLWLPRNSSKQALTGEVVPLADLSVEEREKRLLQDGTPFLTLVGAPGHIMLYLGEYQDRAVILHTLWGLRTRDLWGEEGRLLVGRTVITTLDPGRERSRLTLRIGSLSWRIESMNHLLPPGK